MKIERFEDIDGWKLARELTKSVYKATRSQLFAKDWGLKDQITRAAGSVMHNVAEGFGSGSDTEFRRFLRYSQRSCVEVQSELYIALDQNYISLEAFQDLYRAAEKTKSTIGGFIKYLNSSIK